MFAQQRSQSGPGLSINTGAANSFGSGNNNASQPQSSGLFGSAKPGGLFGASSSATPSATSAGTLFGATTNTNTQSNNLFGQSSAAPSQAGTLFGGSAMSNTSSAPQGSNSLFGAAASLRPQTSLFGTTATSQPQANSIFGGSLTSQPQQVASIFGNTSTQSQQAPSLFSQPPQPTTLFASNPVPQPNTSIFTSLPNTTAQQNQTQQNNAFGNTGQTSLFGNSQNTQQAPFQQSRISTLNPPQQTQRSAFSASIGQYTAAQQTVPGVRIDLSNLKSTTRFNDLYEGLQKEIENIDVFILRQIHFHDECETLIPKIGETVNYIPGDVTFCTSKLDAMERALETDAAAIDSAKDLVRKEVDDARLSFKAIHSLRLPAQLQQSSSWNSASMTAGTSLSAEDDKTASADLISYFSRHTEDMGRKLDGLTKNLQDIESYLAGVEAQQSTQLQTAHFSRGRDGGVKSAEEQVRELAGVLREFEGGILGVAGKVGAARESAQELMLGESFSKRGRS